MTPEWHARFDAKVMPEPNTGCWLWIGATTCGYGRIRIGNRWALAHRLSYERHRGPIPAGLELDHLCRTPRCVNPSHLEAVESRENTLRGVGPTAINARKTLCLKGHPLDGDNLLVSGGRRYCRTCQRARVRKHRAASRSPDRRRADELADALTTPTAQALAEHVHVMTMRIRQIAGFARNARSERHQRLARAHAVRTREAA